MSVTSTADEKTAEIIFIGGLHKSGTSLMHDLLAGSRDISAFSHTGAPEDEGQYLHSELPPDIYHGELLFGLSREAYLTESDYDRDPGVGARMFQSWRKYWSLERPYLLEKSPANVARTTFLQKAFPNSIFIIMIRDVRTLYMASRKNLPLVEAEPFLENWLSVYNAFMKDRRRLRRVMLIRYEDLVFSTESEVQKINAFLGLGLSCADFKVEPGQDLAYRDRWNKFREENPSALAEIELPHWCGDLGYGVRSFA